MKPIFLFFLFLFLGSCTSNTIFEAPKDLIPKDSMSLLLQELYISSSTKNFKNNVLERNVNYMPLVYEKFKIDSTRFKESNYYYITKIDLYQEILKDVKEKLEKRKDKYKALKKALDSVRKDSIKKHKKLVPRVSKVNRLGKEYEEDNLRH